MKKTIEVSHKKAVTQESRQRSEMEEQEKVDKRNESESKSEEAERDRKFDQKVEQDKEKNEKEVTAGIAKEKNDKSSAQIQGRCEGTKGQKACPRASRQRRNERGNGQIRR